MNAHHSASRPQLRPSVEGLESLRLLSGMPHAGAVEPAPLAHAEAIKPIAVVHLQGTIHTTSQVGVGSETLTGSGNLGAVGTASLHEHLILTKSPPSTVTLATRKGQIVLAATDGSGLLIGNNAPTWTGARSFTETYTYTIAGGTGAYTHSTGSGTITTMVTDGKEYYPMISFKFS